METVLECRHSAVLQRGVLRCVFLTFITGIQFAWHEAQG